MLVRNIFQHRPIHSVGVWTAELVLANFRKTFGRHLLSNVLVGFANGDREQQLPEFVLTAKLFKLAFTTSDHETVHRRQRDILFVGAALTGWPQPLLGNFLESSETVLPDHFGGLGVALLELFDPLRKIFRLAHAWLRWYMRIDEPILAV